MSFRTGAHGEWSEVFYLRPTNGRANDQLRRNHAARMKIVVAGTTARLYVNGASQPCLVVTDLKHGVGPGRIALWAHVETDAYFGPVEVTPQ